MQLVQLTGDVLFHGVDVLHCGLREAMDFLWLLLRLHHSTVQLEHVHHGRDPSWTLSSTVGLCSRLATGLTLLL